MNIIQILSLFVLIVFFAAPARAESPFQGGMKYTAMHNKTAPKAPLTATPAPTTQHTGAIRQQSFTNTAAPTTPQESPADKVWKKYRALAAGQATEGEQPLESIDNGKTKLPEVPHVGAVAAVNTQPEQKPKATGFAAVIEKYHQNKEQRGQLRVLHTKRPEAPQIKEINKPATEKPSE